MTRLSGWLLSGLACVSFAVFAQGYPARPIRMIVPFPPGAGTDVVARLVSQRLADSLKSPIVVENRAGAGGAIGAEAVARAEPDGYTLLFVASPFTTVPAASHSAGYDPIRQFAPIALIAVGPLVWAVGPAVPARSLRELLELARARPGLLSYGSAGQGSINHLALELLKIRSGTNFLHVPYKGMGPALLDLAGGQIQMLTTTIPAALPYVKQDKIRIIAVTGLKRSPMLADVPTMHEQGVNGYDVNNYWGIVAPANTGREIVARLNAEVQQLLGSAEFRERLEREGVELAPGGPEKFAAYLAGEYAMWRKIVVEAGIKVD